MSSTLRRVDPASRPTTLVIAHRLSTVRGADQIVVLGRGRVLQRGAHEELMAQGGPYRRMVLRAESAGLSDLDEEESDGGSSDEAAAAPAVL